MSHVIKVIEAVDQVSKCFAAFLNEKQGQERVVGFENGIHEV